MRTDFRSVVTHGRRRSRSDAYTRPSVIRDEDGNPIGRARETSKGYRDWPRFRHGVVCRFVAANLGRPWSEVFSELNRAFPAATLGWLVDWNVEVKTYLVDGEVVDGQGRGMHGYYVDPVDGRLREAPRRPWAMAARRRNACRHLLDPDMLHLEHPYADGEARTELARIDGVWYRLVHRRYEAPSEARRGISVTRDGRRVHLWEALASKRQLTSGEIRRLGLRGWGPLSRSLGSSLDDPRACERLSGEMESILKDARSRLGTRAAPR